VPATVEAALRPCADPTGDLVFAGYGNHSLYPDVADHTTVFNLYIG